MSDQQISDDNRCVSCGHPRACHNQDTGAGEMCGCSECACREFTLIGVDELEELFKPGALETKRATT